MDKIDKIQASVWKMLQRYRDNGDNSEVLLWQQDDFIHACKNTENAIKSMVVLKKHLPVSFHDLVRFSQPNTQWILSVRKSVIKHKITMLLDELSLRIARDIGYAPAIRVVVQPSKHTWENSGFALTTIEPNRIELPSEEEAKKIINDFLAKSFDDDKNET